jgi:hypothetical protein
MSKDRAPLEQFDGPYKARGADPTDAVILPGLASTTDGPTPRERLIVAMRDSGLTYRQMANALGIGSANGLRVDVARARKKLKAVSYAFDAAVARIDSEIFPLAVERLAGMVNAGVPEAVFRTLAGRAGGLQPPRADAAPPPLMQTTLNVQFSLPPGIDVASRPTIALGSVVGAPRALLAAPVMETPNATV